MSIKPVLSLRGVFLATFVLCLAAMATAAISGRYTPSMLVEMFTASAAGQEKRTEVEESATVEPQKFTLHGKRSVGDNFGVDSNGIVFGLGDYALFGFQHLRTDKI